MADDQDRLTKLEALMQDVTNQLWRLQGRMNAMEIAAGLEVFNMAKTQPYPFQWVQDYVEAMRVTIRGLIPDVDDHTKAERLNLETKGALEEFLEQLVRQAGQLKGAPGSQGR